jgi:hypothetical protein
MASFVLYPKVAVLVSVLAVTIVLTTLAAPVMGPPVPVTDPVGRYQKFEMRVPLSDTAYTNPYDFEPALGGALLRATFTSPLGTVTTVDGFHADGYALSDTNTGALSTVPSQDGWRVRFTPTELGAYRYRLTFQDGSGTSAARTGTFTAVASTAPGFIRRQAGRNYLRFDSNDPYIPVGENLCWAASGGLGEFKTYLDKLALNRANLVRLWLCHWGIELEWQDGSGTGYAGLKTYAQNHAYELDWLLDYGAAHGLYINLCLSHHGQFRAGSNWPANPYNSTNNGPCTTSEAFFSNPAAKAVYKNKLRYLVARYAYSPNLMAWELFNELNLIDDYAANRTNTAAWCGEMAAYLKSVDPNRHLVSTSYTMDSGQTDVWNNASIDFTQIHTYELTPDLEKPMAEASAALTAAHNKPFLSGEFGIAWENGQTMIDDPDGTSFRNTLWGSAFNGSMGPGLTWWWDEWVHPLDDKTYPVILQLRNFLDANVNVVANNYLPVIPEVRTPSCQTLSLTPWFDGFPPPTYNAAKAPCKDYRVNIDGSLSPTETSLGRYLFGRWHTAQRHPPTFTFNQPLDGEFKVNVGLVGNGGATLVIKRDGATVLTRGNPVAGGVYTIRVPAGAHTITLDNTGNDWIQVAALDFTRFLPTITGRALRDGERMVGYLRLRDYNWEYLAASGQVPPPAVTGGTLTVRGLRPARPYSVTFTSVSNGARLRAGRVTASRAGVIEIALPVLTRDLAFVVDSPVGELSLHAADLDVQLVPQGNAL